MIPRVFVSSTYYDLKHVRERLEKFITSYSFEPVLFESDKVTYEFGKPLDQSAYYEVGLCHIMVLIIGGRYGTPSSPSSIDLERKLYNDEYVSVTRRELETAFQKKIPVFIFVDKNVHAEYQTYKENQDFFENYESEVNKEPLKKLFRFAHVDDMNVFRFIDGLSSNPIKTFEKVEEVEVYLKLQFAGMFYLYLESLKKETDDKKILDTVNELNNITLRMNEMLNSVGKKILGNSADEYEKVIEIQFDIVMDFFKDQIYQKINFEGPELTDEQYESINFRKAAMVLYENIFENDLTYYKDIKTPYNEIFRLQKEKKTETLKRINDELEKYYSEIYPNISIADASIFELNNIYLGKVKPLIIGDSNKEKLLAKIEYVVDIKLSPSPF